MPPSFFLVKIPIFSELFKRKLGHRSSHTPKSQRQSSANRFGRGAQSNGCELILPIGFPELGCWEPFESSFFEEESQEGQVVGVLVPLLVDVRVNFDEGAKCVGRLHSPLTGREVGSGNQV
jgi:hypothetical protein